MSDAVVALVGPTASGKSQLAMALAETRPIEIISMDSAQVYRGMDIGTAKPSAAERAAVPHHLIDIRDPAEPYSAAQFASDAQRIVDEVRRRGRIPLIVGGTMLYLKALSEGLAPLPSADPEFRRRVGERAARLGWPALHAELVRVDPKTADRLSPNDGHRILRALEIHALSGQPASRLLRQRSTAQLSVRVLCLWPPSRELLWQRIAQRFAAMMDAGLLDEVRGLYARADLHPGLPAIRSVGYRQLWEHLAGRWTLDEAVQRAIFATRQLAKRQQTWMRSLADAEALPADGAEALRMLQRSVDASN